MMSRISSILFKTAHARNPHPAWAIDGVSLDLWLAAHVSGQDAAGLVPAQGWLVDDDEYALAWQRIEAVEPETSTIVPVLVCPDDVDLDCSVIVVEQEAHLEHITWRRFGHARSGGLQVGVTTAWFAGVPALEFPRDQFIRALAQFKDLIKVWE